MKSRDSRIYQFLLDKFNNELQDCPEDFKTGYTICLTEMQKEMLKNTPLPKFNPRIPSFFKSKDKSKDSNLKGNETLD